MTENILVMGEQEWGGVRTINLIALSLRPPLCPDSEIQTKLTKEVLVKCKKSYEESKHRIAFNIHIIIMQRTKALRRFWASVRRCPWLSHAPGRVRGLQPTRLLCVGYCPSENTNVGYHALLQRIFPNHGSHQHLLSLLHCRLAEPLGRPGRHSSQLSKTICFEGPPCFSLAWHFLPI